MALCKKCDSKQASRDTLYRMVNFYYLCQFIVQDNILPQSKMYALKVNGKRQSGVSFSRNARFTFDKSVRLVVDGKKLGQRYKIHPVLDPGGYGVRNQKNLAGGYVEPEAEEFVIGGIDNIQKYLSKIDINYNSAKRDFLEMLYDYTEILDKDEADITEEDFDYLLRYIQEKITVPVNIT